jgi:mannose-6-phosphate isomerase-like protein (cupin superfamily)
MENNRKGVFFTPSDIAEAMGFEEEPKDETTDSESEEKADEPEKKAVKGFVDDIESLSVKNENFRQVLYTAEHCQLVVMSLKPKEEIGEEVHKLDQFFRVEEGTGTTVINGVKTEIKAGTGIIIPAGAKHNIINTSEAPLKLYTIYSPPNHRDKVTHNTKEEASADNETYDGKTTE